MKSKKFLFALPLLLGVLILSCQDEETGGSESKVQDVVVNATIEKAKTIFESKSPDFPVIQSRSANGVEKGIVFEPTWEEAFVSEHNDGSTTVETHVLLSQPFHMLPQDSREAYERTKDGRYLQHLSRAVVLMKDDQSTPHAFLMSIIGSKKYMEEHDFQLWDVSYGNIPEDFSGQILYHALDGSFVNGWYVEEGHKYSTCEPISEEDANLLSRATVTECALVTGYRYFWNCRKNDEIAYKTYEDHSIKDTTIYCTGSFQESYYYTVCALVNPSGGTGGPFQGGGYYVPTADASRLFTSYSANELRNQLKGFISYMEYNDVASKAVLDYIENTISSMYQKLNVQIDTTQSADVRYSPSNNTVYFKSVNHYSDLVLYEELIHAAQRVVYSDYWEGPFNIEFEAKLIMDYARLSSGSKGHTDLAANMEYAELELQNGSVKTMSAWLRDLPYSYFEIADFWGYMNIWKDISLEYKDYMMGFRMEPKLIFPIIDEMNDN